MFSFLLFAYVGQVRPSVDLSKGSHLFGSCEAALRLSEQPGTQQARVELASSTYCFGYIGGYVEGVNRVDQAICTNGANLDDMVRVYVEYMRQNQQLQKESRQLGLLLALKNSYPCSSQLPK